MPKRLGHWTELRVVLVDIADAPGPELGPNPRPKITQALSELNVELQLGAAVVAIDAGGVTLASGERIESETAIWTVGVRATPLTKNISTSWDALGRLRVDQNLRVPSAGDVFATGDTDYALADTKGHRVLMPCQHANKLGRVSGHNAAADILGELLVEYSQPGYICCLDLGAWGALVSGGWERDVKATGDMAKWMKSFINQKLIYPPTNMQDGLSAAYPIGPDSNKLLEWLFQAVPKSTQKII